MKPFAVIIPHFGDDALLDKCLDELHKWGEWVSCVRIIDNNKTNVGFTKACNLGLLEEIKDPTGEYLLLLNNDCWPLVDPFQPIYERLKNDRVGIVAPKNVGAEDQDQILWGGSGAVIPGVHRTGSVRLGQWMRPSQERWASFSVVALQRAMLRRIGLLDERLFNICSDSDYCYRARSRGWQIWYEARSTWAHAWRSSRDPQKSHEPIHFMDAYRFQEKWLGDSFFQLTLEC
jgi:GT2 family glycosyltransferase